MRRRLMHRKWARRGKACAEFILAIFAVLIEWLLVALWAILTSLVSLFVAARNRRHLVGSRESKKAREPDVEMETDEPRLEALAPITVPSVRFNTVAGLDEAKQEITVRTLLPLQHPSQAAAYNVATGGGLLLWGPPGCGKTLLARAVAGELQCPFFHARPSDLMNQWVGQSEKNLAALFKKARSCQRSVIFLDEIDSLCPSRRRNHSTIMQRVISEFLSQMDGLDAQCSRKPADGFLLVVGATNWIESLDDAVLRPGRFDVRVFVGLPDDAARRQIIDQSVAGRPVSERVSLDDLVKRTDGFSGADVTNVVETAARQAFLTSIRDLDTAQPISANDFNDALTKVRPTISRQEMSRYISCANL